MTWNEANFALAEKCAFIFCHSLTENAGPISFIAFALSFYTIQIIHSVTSIQFNTTDLNMCFYASLYFTVYNLHSFLLPILLTVVYTNVVYAKSGGHLKQKA